MMVITVSSFIQNQLVLAGSAVTWLELQFHEATPESSGAGLEGHGLLLNRNWVLPDGRTVPEL
jgi:hypothetical protein